MSTFCGRFDEFDYLSVDRFDGKNLDSKIFFLSHCHSDHMIGLNQVLPGPLYLSGASAVIIGKQYSHIPLDLRILEIGSSQDIECNIDGSNKIITVTAFPARHCPGSIMLLFESISYKILYTGDFRLVANDLKKTLLPLSNNQIDCMYLDSTFLNKNYPEFPRQKQSVDFICQLINNWITQDEKNKIFLKLSARYGSEYLFINIWHKLKQKVHVTESQWSKYIHFPDMDFCISKEAANCKIHACILRNSFECKDQQVVNSITIKPSAIVWRNWKVGDKLFEKLGNIYRVAYSNHSSLNEIKSFIKFINPKSIKLNVMPQKDQQTIQETLKEILYENKVPKPKINKKLVYTFDKIIRFSTKTSSNSEMEGEILPKRKKGHLKFE